MKYLRPYNESFSSSKDFEQALEIYAEELPFSMSDISISDLRKKHSYVVSYNHIDDSIVLDKIPTYPKNKIVTRDGINALMAAFIIKQHDIIKNKVAQSTDLYFTRFAKKHDLLASPSQVSVYWVENGMSNNDLYDSQDSSNQKVLITVSIRFIEI